MRWFLHFQWRSSRRVSHSRTSIRRVQPPTLLLLLLLRDQRPQPTRVCSLHAMARCSSHWQRRPSWVAVCLPEVVEVRPSVASICRSSKRCCWTSHLRSSWSPWHWLRRLTSATSSPHNPMRSTWMGSARPCWPCSKPTNDPSPPWSWASQNKTSQRQVPYWPNHIESIIASNLIKAFFFFFQSMARLSFVVLECPLRWPPRWCAVRERSTSDTFCYRCSLRCSTTVSYK